MGRAGDLEIDHDSQFQKTYWRLQRAAWIVMLLVIVAAALGLAGAGPLNDATASSGGLRVEYSRFPRMGSSADLVVTLAPAAVPADAVTIWIASDYLRRLEISGIVPEPEAAASAGGRIAYTFRGTPGQPFTVLFRLTTVAGAFGAVAAEMGVENGPRVEFRQFVWP